MPIVSASIFSIAACIASFAFNPFKKSLLQSVTFLSVQVFSVISTPSKILGKGIKSQIETSPCLGSTSQKSSDLKWLPILVKKIIIVREN